MNAPPPESITQARERILHTVQRGMVRRRRRRHATQLAAVAGLFALIASGFWLAPNPPPQPADILPRPVAVAPTPDTLPPSTSDSTANPVAPQPFASIRLVAMPAPSGHVRTVSSESTSSLIRRVDDRELVLILAQTGRDVGLVHFDTGETRVVCNSCSSDDEWLTPLDPPSPPLSPNRSRDPILN